MINNENVHGEFDRPKSQEGQEEILAQVLNQMKVLNRLLPSTLSEDELEQARNHLKSILSLVKGSARELNEETSSQNQSENTEIKQKKEGEYKLSTEDLLHEKGLNAYADLQELRSSVYKSSFNNDEGHARAAAINYFKSLEIETFYEMLNIYRDEIKNTVHELEKKTREMCAEADWKIQEKLIKEVKALWRELANLIDLVKGKKDEHRNVGLLQMKAFPWFSDKPLSLTEQEENLESLTEYLKYNHLWDYSKPAQLIGNESLQGKSPQEEAQWYLESLKSILFNTTQEEYLVESTALKKHLFQNDSETYEVLNTVYKKELQKECNKISSVAAFINTRNELPTNEKYLKLFELRASIEVLLISISMEYPKESLQYKELKRQLDNLYEEAEYSLMSPVNFYAEQSLMKIRETLQRYSLWG